MQPLDFTYYIENEYFVAYKVYDARVVCVLCKNLRIATSDSQKPAFILEAVRGITPFSKPLPYAQLEMQMEPAPLNEVSLAKISAKWPGLVLQFTDINSGYLIITLFKDDDDIGVELDTPIPLTNMPLSRLRIVKPMSIQYFQLFQTALQNEFLLMSAKGWYSVVGYAPLVEATVQFNPVRLTNTIKSFIANEDGYIVYDELFFLFRNKISLLPVDISPAGVEGDAFATSFTSRYLEYFCEPLAAVNTVGEVCFAFNELAQQEGLFTWNLLKLQIVHRYISYTLRGLRDMHEMIKGGSFSEYIQTRIVESLPTGFTQVAIYHPFFMLPVGVKQIGVKISASPVSPFRLQAINETITFDSGTARKIVTLRFSPKEKYEYQVTPFLIIDENGITRELQGESFASHENILFIQQDQFPLQVRAFSCNQALMDAAEVKLEILSAEEKEEMLPSTIFTTKEPYVMYAFSKIHLQDWIVRVAATDRRNLRSKVSKEFNLLKDLKINFTSFECYGLHTTTIKLNPETDELIAIDLLPECAEEIAENITSIALTKNKTEHIWQWYASSLFKTGFRYRLPLSDNKEWSKVLSWNLSELIVPKKKYNMINKTVFEDIVFYPDVENEGVYFFYSLSPEAQKDGNGNPMVSLMGAGEYWFLLVSSVWQVDSLSLERLARKLKQEKRIKEETSLKPAPVNIEKAELILITNDKEHVLSTSHTSGYYPFSAVFNATVTNEQQLLIAPAFTGSTGNVIVKYTASLNVPNTIKIQLSGSPDTMLKMKDVAHDTAVFITAINEALSNGQWQLTVNASTDVTDEEMVAMKVEAIELAAKEIFDTYKGNNKLDEEEREFNLVYDKTISTKEELIVSADLATWLSGVGPDYIKIVK